MFGVGPKRMLFGMVFLFLRVMRMKSGVGDTLAGLMAGMKRGLIGF
jgi:hypothetical protein